MNWTICGASKSSEWNEVIPKSQSRGASMRDTRSSKYSLAPLNPKRERARRTERICGGGKRFSGSGQDRGDSKLSRNSLRLLFDADRPETTASGEMYPE